MYYSRLIIIIHNIIPYLRLEIPHIIKVKIKNPDGEVRIAVKRIFIPAFPFLQFWFALAVLVYLPALGTGPEKSVTAFLFF
jgi:hypothetical protein